MVVKVRGTFRIQMGVAQQEGAILLGHQKVVVVPVGDALVAAPDKVRVLVLGGGDREAGARLQEGHGEGAARRLQELQGGGGGMRKCLCTI
jgi:hypothetical protein